MGVEEQGSEEWQSDGVGRGEGRRMGEWKSLEERRRGSRRVWGVGVEEWKREEEQDNDYDKE